jgi:hypothetical protein
MLILKEKKLEQPQILLQAVFRIRIRIQINRIHILSGFADPDPLVKGMDPNPHPDSGSFYEQAKLVRKTWIPTVL